MFKNLFKPKTLNSNEPVTFNSNTGKALENPFVAGSEGRREWNDRYGNLAQAIRHWQWAFAGALATVLVFALVLAKMATTSRVEPFVVETNQGAPYALKPMTGGSAEDPRLINFALNQFIINARSVVADSEAEKALLNKVYAYSADTTLSYLQDYYAEHNPFTVASQYTVTVTIINSLPLSHHTWQITWDEIEHSPTSGSVLSVHRWMAMVTYRFGDLNPHFLNDNPFGLYITNVSWSPVQTAE